MVKSNNQLVTFYKYLMTRFYFNIRIYVQDLSLVAAAIGWLPTLISYPGGRGVVGCGVVLEPAFSLGCSSGRRSGILKKMA